MNKKVRLCLLGVVILVTFLGVNTTLMKPLFSQSENVPFDVSIEFVPCGWIGDAGDPEERYVKLEPYFSDDSRPDNQAIKVDYVSRGTDNWAGIYWLPPDGDGCNWGQNPGIPILGATKVTFWAKSERAGERIQFKVGGVQSPGPYVDTFADSEVTELTTTWQLYEIDVSDQNFEEVLGAFAWVARNPPSEGITFYLDDIRYE
ncbi:MAG: hypothetical protein F6K42_05235 [Leptolyngbya sp. SIO1D8]|nr:hypothetical protein [Leptolyngbya sp. SIO1D8]